MQADAIPFTGHPERSVGQDGKITWSEGLESGYRWYADQGVKPLFPFGYGLSYTTFGYAGLKAAAARDGGLDVRNTGRRAGAAVPQVYLGPSPDLPAAFQQVNRKLVQFDRVELRPGAARTVTLHVASREPAAARRPPGRSPVNAGRAAPVTVRSSPIPRPPTCR